MGTDRPSVQGSHAQLALVLRRLRKAKGLSQLAMARPLHLKAHSAIADYESGRTIPPADVVEGYERFFGVPGGSLTELRNQAIAERAECEESVGPPPEGTGTVTGLAGGIVPRQLPISPANFAGRENELAQLGQLLALCSAPQVIAVSGMAGVGKTTLALHWAHDVAEWFPDGQLYLNLRGYDTLAAPVTPARAVRGLLDSLGVPPERIPVDLDAQAALYRSLLADRHILVVLDNARDGEQVRPLLPGSPGCVALVTSRSHLTSLIITDGAYPLILDVLNNHEARDLLAGRIGQNRVDAEPEAAEHIIASCGRLPLALSVVAARAAAHPTFSLRALARELRDSSTGELDALDNDEATVSLRTAFCRSYEQLSSPAARMFRLLALHPGPDITIAAAASLAGLSATTARSVLTELASAYLTTEQEPGRFTLHELLRAYAAERVKHQDSGAERHAASRRMLDHYLHTAHSASRLINPHPVYGPLSLEQPCAGTVLESLADDRAASTWFDAEYLVLIAVADHAAATCEDTHAWQLAGSLNEYCRRQGRWEDWLNIQRTALTSAQRQDSRLGQACAHAAIGRACSWLGRHDDAGAHLHQALHLFGELGDKPGQASIHMSLAWIADRQYHAADALANDRQALALYRAAEHAPGLASALNNLGWSYTQLGDYSQALACCQEALALQRRLDDLRGQAHTVDSLGYAHHHLGQHKEAAASFRQALALYQQFGSLNSQVEVLDHLGDSLAAAGDRAAANANWTRALDILTEISHPAAHLIRAKIYNQGESSTACDPGQ
jgi:tetratricopeptide (TPR) repeat protein